MGMPNTAKRWTREEVQALPDDGNRYEDDRPEILAERIAWQPSQDGEPLEINLEEYFSEVWRE